MPGNLTCPYNQPAKLSSDANNGPHADGRGVATPTLPANVPHSFTMTDQEVASELSVSAKTIRRMNAAGSLPCPLLVGSRRLRWVRQRIVEWIALGCPDRETFEAFRKGGR